MNKNLAWFGTGLEGEYIGIGITIIIFLISLIPVVAIVKFVLGTGLKKDKSTKNLTSKKRRTR